MNDNINAINIFTSPLRKKTDDGDEKEHAMFFVYFVNDKRKCKGLNQNKILSMFVNPPKKQKMSLIKNL